jgi:hypothetical protein
MGACDNIAGGGVVCKTIQVLEPDSTLPVQNWRIDPGLDEQGDFPLTQGQDSASVVFQTPKASANYRFEFLYVDTLGITLPGDIEPVVTGQTQFGFTVEFAGTPLAAGYILRWRVVVIDTTITEGFLDTPESLYIRLPQGTDLFTATFINPRSTMVFGFSELRIENLTDPPDQQTFVAVQVVTKTQLNFTVGLNPSPPSGNYFLVARTP